MEDNREPNLSLKIGQKVAYKGHTGKIVCLFNLILRLCILNLMKLMNSANIQKF